MSNLITNSPKMFQNFPELSAGITIRRGTLPPWQDMNFGFRSLNGAVTSGEYAQAEKTAMDLRDQLRRQLLGQDSVLTHTHQTHSDIVIEVPTEGDNWGSLEADAMVTTQPRNLLTLLVADCAGIILYDPKTKVLGVVHSGWRGTKANIATKAIRRMQTLGAQPAHIYAYISPAICVNHYEVGEAFSAHFDQKYLPQLHGSIHFDNTAALGDQLQTAGISHVEIDPRCTYQDDLLHSYRRDGQTSGRLAVFAGLR